MTPVFENVTCALCKSNDFEVLNKIGQHGLPANVVLCKQCGLGFLNPRWTASCYSEFYKTDYDKYYRPQFVRKSVDSGTSSVVKAPVIPSFSRMKEAGILPPDPKMILDIGSGNGGFIDQSRTVFPQAKYFAIEPSEHSQKALKQKNIDFVSADVDSGWESTYSGKFDLINMRHVLEHFMDPSVVLQKVRSVLSEKGVVYIAVPNSMNPSLPLLRHFFRVVHTYYFNKKTLTALAKRAGLKVLLVIEGDAYNKHELVLVCTRGETEEAVSNAFREQRDLFMKYIRHESGLGYRFRTKLRSLISRTSGGSED